MPRKKAEPENVNISEEQVESQVNDIEQTDVETALPDMDIMSEVATKNDDISKEPTETIEPEQPETSAPDSEELSLGVLKINLDE